MTTRDAVDLIRNAIPGPGGDWADFGAGDGVFTRALAERLGPAGRIFAVDRDAHALAVLGRWAAGAGVRAITVVADFSSPFELPGLGPGTLDGILLANALHFVDDPRSVLERLVGWLRPGGRVVLVEYDRRSASRWVPYPIPSAQWSELSARAGLSTPAIVATQPSLYGGELYVAVADLPVQPQRLPR